MPNIQRGRSPPPASALLRFAMLQLPAVERSSPKLRIICSEEAEATEEEPMRVVRLGGTLQPYQPLRDTLFTIFASEVNEAGDVLRFIQRFGPLTRDGLDPEIGDSVSDILFHAKTMRRRLAVMAAKNGDKSTLMEPSATKSRRGSSSGEGLNIAVEFDYDIATNALKLKFRPSDLLNAIWVEFVHQGLFEDIAVRQCQHCGSWFLAGGSTGRRIDAKFCSVGHRTLYNSLKRSRGT